MGTKPTLLAQPGKFGTLELKNRLVMPAMCTNYTYQGHFTDEAVHYYGLRAKGGVGLIIIEAAAIDYPIGRSVINCAVSHDRFIPTLKKLTDEIHKYGAKVSLQIMHSGRQSSSATGGTQPISCSNAASAQALYKEAPREMTTYEVKECIKQFGEAALRAKQAGFDTVEAHFAHGYLGSSFLSPFLNNTRSDEYAGMEGGLRFATEVIRSIKKHCGEDYPVMSRINGDDYYPAGGVTSIDSLMISVALEKAGCDCINISSGLRESNHPLHDQTAASPRGSWIYMAEGIKKTVKVPVMIAKRISEDMAEGVLESGAADFVCIGRPQISDPEYANKLLSGHPEDIKPCIWCAQGCFDVLWMLAPTTCLTNPAAGRLNETSLEELPQASQKKNVLVVGGGPAGCEAALIAAKRGHKVTLHEKDARLGGAFRQSVPSPAKAENERLAVYMEKALPKAGVEVVLGSEVTADGVAAAKPDVVIVAVGADPVVPVKIPGHNLPNIVTVEDVMTGKATVGQRVAIWTCSKLCSWTCGVKEAPIEGDLTGCTSKTSHACRAGYAAVDAAEYLASQGKLVRIVTERSDVVPGMGYTSRGYLLRRFYKANIRVSSNLTVKEITPVGLKLEKYGYEFLLDADTVIVSVGDRSRRDLAKALEGKVPELHVVGDGQKIGNAMKAIASGFDVAMQL